MIDHKLVQHHIQKLKSGDLVLKSACQPKPAKLPSGLRQYVDILGPVPKQSLEALADLGLSDKEIARYHMIPQHCVSALRDIWHIDGQAQ